MPLILVRWLRSGLCSLRLYQALPRGFPVNVPHLPLKVLGRGALHQDVVQLTLSRHLGRACAAPPAVTTQVHACIRLLVLAGGHLALRLASTVRRFGASTSSVSTASSSWGQPIMAGALPCHSTPPASSRSSAMRSGDFVAEKFPR